MNTEFKFTNPLTGRIVTGKTGRSSHMSPTWKWGVLVNDSGDVVLFKNQKHVVAYAQYRWGTFCNFVLTRYCAKGSKS